MLVKQMRRLWYETYENYRGFQIQIITILLFDLLDSDTFCGPTHQIASIPDFINNF